MYNRLRANIAVNFIYYRRNRLLLATTMLLLLITGFSAIPAAFFLTKSQHLSIIIMICKSLSGFATVITGGLGLLLISQHISNRSVKLVFTKPCPPEQWLMGSFVSAATVAAAFYALILIVGTTLFLYWKLPFQAGLPYIVLNDFCHAIIWLSYLSFLAVVFHPVVAFILVFVFQEGTFYWFQTLLASGIKASAGKTALVPLLKTASVAVQGIYYLLPSTHPFGDKSGQVYESLRITNSDWGYLAGTIGYTCAVSLFFFLAAERALKRKRLI